MGRSASDRVSTYLSCDAESQLGMLEDICNNESEWFIVVPTRWFYLVNNLNQGPSTVPAGEIVSCIHMDKIQVISRSNCV